MSFKRLHQERFDHQHDGDEGESIGQDTRHVEQLERDPDLEADAIRAARATRRSARFSRPATARSGRRPQDRARVAAGRRGACASTAPMRNTCAISSNRAIERARAFAHRHGRERQLVERDGCDGRGLGQAGPDIGQHDDHQRRQVEQHHEPGVAEPIGERGTGPSRDRSRCPAPWRSRMPPRPAPRSPPD